MVSSKRTSEEWWIAAERIYHVSNDSFIISNLVLEVKWLGELDILIQEYCELWETWKAPINIGYRITMLSRLFVLHAYEIVRCLDEFDNNRKVSSWGNLANFKTWRFQKLKKILEWIRVPLVKLQETQSWKDKESLKSSFVTIGWNWRFIYFTSNEWDEIILEIFIQEIFETINSYTREKI